MIAFHSHHDQAGFDASEITMDVMISISNDNDRDDDHDDGNVLPLCRGLFSRLA